MVCQVMDGAAIVTMMRKSLGSVRDDSGRVAVRCGVSQVSQGVADVDMGE